MPYACSTGNKVSKLLQMNGHFLVIEHTKFQIFFNNLENQRIRTKFCDVYPKSIILNSQKLQKEKGNRSCF